MIPLLCVEGHEHTYKGAKLFVALPSNAIHGVGGVVLPFDWNRGGLWSSSQRVHTHRVQDSGWPFRTRDQRFGFQGVDATHYVSVKARSTSTALRCTTSSTPRREFWERKTAPPPATTRQRVYDESEAWKGQDTEQSRGGQNWVLIQNGHPSAGDLSTVAWQHTHFQCSWLPVASSVEKGERKQWIGGRTTQKRPSSPREGKYQPALETGIARQWSGWERFRAVLENMKRDSQHRTLQQREKTKKRGGCTATTELVKESVGFILNVTTDWDVHDKMMRVMTSNNKSTNTHNTSSNKKRQHQQLE